jgi:hypothetical protein
VQDSSSQHLTEQQTNAVSKRRGPGAEESAYNKTPLQKRKAPTNQASMKNKSVKSGDEWWENKL